MKYLATNRQARDELPSTERKWFRIHFYFDFSARGGISNTIHGMLKSMALQLAEGLSEAQRHFNASAINYNLEQAAIPDLKEQIRKAVEKANVYVLAFVDGLDEYTGDLVELVQSLISLNDHSFTKMCLASRPDGPLHAALDKYPNLKMQDYNKSSIRLYMKEAIDLRKLKFKSGFPTHLQDKIIEDANGIILWARFVIDHLLDGCDQGLNAEELSERYNHLPKEVEDFYDLILARLSQDIRSEAAFILYLLLNKSGLCMLDELQGAYSFALQGTELNFAPDDPKLPVNFKSRLIANFGGLVEIIDVEKEAPIFGAPECACAVTLLHKTIETHLLKSNWVWKNLNDRLKTRYPSCLWLRVYASVIEYAAPKVDLDWNEALHLAFLPPSKIDTNVLTDVVQKISPRREPLCDLFILPYALANSLKTAEENERDGQPTLEIIKNIMDREIMLLHVLRSYRSFEVSGYERACCRLDFCSEIYKSITKTNLGLIVGISHNLPSYIQSRLQKMPRQLRDEKEFILDAAFYFWYSRNSSCDIEMVKPLLNHYGGGIRRRHICLLMDSASMSMLSTMVVLELRKLTQNRPVEPWSLDHHPNCSYVGKDCSPLYEWALLVRSIPFLEELLTFLLGTGERVTNPCYSGGNVMYAILDRSQSGWSDEYPRRLIKLLLALKAVPDPLVVCQEEDILACVEKLKWHLRFRIFRKWCANDLKDTKVIGYILREFKQGRRTLFDHYCDKMDETLQRDRLIFAPFFT